MSKKWIGALAAVVVAALLIYTQLTFFVIQPMGMLPEGKTLVILRLNSTEFVDSADAICERRTGGVSLLCRGFTLAGVARNSTILLRLPYSQWLYEISTGGKIYEK